MTTDIKEEIYRIIDAFLVEANNLETGKPVERSLHRLNEDRHLAADRLMALLAKRDSELVEATESKRKIFTGKEEIPNSGGQSFGKKYIEGYNQALDDVLSLIKQV